MTTRRTYVLALAIILGFAGSTAYSNEETSPPEESPHKVALFVGGGFERDKNGHEENGAATGLVYELEFSEKWGAGVALEYLSGSDVHRAWVVAVPVSYYLTPKWRLFVGPGKEIGGKHDKLLMRTGVAYGFPFNDRWTASPEVVVDFAEGGARTFVLGLSLAYGF